MSDEPTQIGPLAEWFRTRAQPFLEKLHPERTAEMSADLTKLVKMEERLPTEMTACFLGASGVGKSTLINALVGGSMTLLPAGGVGPMTAQALTVRYGREPRFEVSYHSAGKLNQVMFGLQQTLEAERRVASPDPVPFEVGEEADEPAGPDLPETPKGSPDGAAVKRATDRKTAQLLVTGNQDNQSELDYLVDGLREALGRDRVWGTVARAEDVPRLAAIRGALELAKDGRLHVRQGSLQDREFLTDLRTHASGFLAPLIKELTVYWDSDLLTGGVTVVDLPGVGISGDVYREITRKWIREKAEAVVLVVDKSGITDAVAELLDKSEFLDRLVHTADDPTRDPVLMVAVVKVDDVAESRYADDEDRSEQEHFTDVCAEMAPVIHGQMRQQLENVRKSSKGLSDTQRQVIDNILSTFQVHPLSAIQYRKALRASTGAIARPFLSAPELSNVPRFQKALSALAGKRRAEAGQRLRESRDGFLDRVLSILAVTQAQWEEETRAGEEAERLREDLAVFMDPLRKELHVRQGQYRAFLKKAVPQRIVDLVAAAKGRARVEITHYLRPLATAHFATLRASVRHGGRFKGATDIDLPREFARRFEEPVAEAWTKQILKDIRRETREYADDCVKLVERVVVWAREQGTRVKPRLIEAQRDAIKADATKLDAVGREMVAELRDEVKNQLIEAIDAPIRGGCGKFVKRNADIGAGVKNRILELFAELANEVTEIAEKPAVKILTHLFGEVEKEISAAFENHQDPLAASAEAIVSSQEDYRRRSDKQKQRKVLGELEQVRSACPVPPDYVGGSTRLEPVS